MCPGPAADSIDYYINIIPHSIYIHILRYWSRLPLLCEVWNIYARRSKTRSKLDQKWYIIISSFREEALFGAELRFFFWPQLPYVELWCTWTIRESGIGADQRWFHRLLQISDSTLLKHSADLQAWRYAVCHRSVCPKWQLFRKKNLSENEAILVFS